MLGLARACLIAGSALGEPGASSAAEDPPGGLGCMDPPGGLWCMLWSCAGGRLYLWGAFGWL